MTHKRDLPNNTGIQVAWDSEPKVIEQMSGSGMNIFKMLQAFAQEQMLDAADKKQILQFSRDTELESLMLDGEFDVDNLSTEQKKKLNEYYALFANIKLESNMSEATAKKIMKRLEENETLVRKVKKKRWKDVKREMKN